jgi:tetratricopeptide (TPR) repeat protein
MEHGAAFRVLWIEQLTRLTILLSSLAFAVCAAEADLTQARMLYGHTDYQGALKILLAGDQSSSPAQFWLGRNYYMLREYKKAHEAFEKAVAATPANSEYVDWLGRAYGRRAETSSFLTAPSYAAKARDNFEKAVALDPHNSDAAGDLFEYYMDAPGFLGGGIDKATALSAKINEMNPAEGQYTMAVIAEHHKDFNSAEVHFRRAMELAPQQVGRVLDLAKFLSKQGRTQESDQVFARAEKVAPEDPRILFERASTYIQAKRNQDQARNLLQQYLKSPLTPDYPSREEAEKLLKSASSGL